MLQKLSRLARDRGDFARTAAAAAEVLDLAPQLGDRWIAAQCFEDLAAVAAAVGQAEGAARLFGAAEAQREAAGMPLPPAERAEYERHVGFARRRLGGDPFARARAAGRAFSFEEAVRWARRVADSPLEAATGRTADDRRLLTPRQLQVAALIRAGLSNRRIADELVISELTAETHVRTILQRLGFTSRAQIAAWATEQGLAERAVRPE